MDEPHQHRVWGIGGHTECLPHDVPDAHFD